MCGHVYTLSYTFLQMQVHMCLEQNHQYTLVVEIRHEFLTVTGLSLALSIRDAVGKAGETLLPIFLASSISVLLAD